VLHAKLRNRTC